MKTAKITIDGNIYTVDVFEVNGKQLTTDVNLVEGQHTLTKIELYDDENLEESKDLTMEFNLEATFPIELPIDFGKQKMSMKATSEAPSPVYLNMPKIVTPPPETKTAKIIGTLGIPEEDKHFYQDDDYYNVKPITNKVKLRFCVHIVEINEAGDGTEQNEWFMYNWGEVQPLEIYWNKPKGDNPVNIIFQMYYVQMINGEKKMADVNLGPNGYTWKIDIFGDEEPVKDENGFTTISLMPDESWLSNADYQYYYI